jgi:hypothetical protein
VLHADPERACGGDAGRDHGVGQHAVAVELKCPPHLQPVGRAAADHRDAGAENRIRAADDLILVAGQAIGEKQQHAMGMARGRGQAAGRDGAGVAKILGRPGRGRGADDEAVSAQSGNHDAAVARAVPRDLARGRAADKRYATRSRADLADQVREVLGRRAEDNQQLGVVVDECSVSRAPAGVIG